MFIEPDDAGVFLVDPKEPRFTEDEIAQARRIRMTLPHPQSLRADLCPHREPCGSVPACLERIAWYRRYQAQIEAHLTEHDLQPHSDTR